MTVALRNAVQKCFSAWPKNGREKRKYEEKNPVTVCFGIAPDRMRQQADGR